MVYKVICIERHLSKGKYNHMLKLPYAMKADVNDQTAMQKENTSQLTYPKL